MPRFFVPASAVGGGRASVDGDDAAHLARSLRATAGERIVVADDAGTEHGVLLDTVTAERCAGAVEWSRPATGEPGVEVHVVQALAKDGMDELVEALAEVGAASIWPVTTRRTVVRLDARRAEHRVARWNAIARNAAGLAGRARPPVVHPLRGIADVPAALPPNTRLMVCSPEAVMPLNAVLVRRETRVAVCVGPEGGFDAEDLQALRRSGAHEVHLGPRVLRARLAAVVALSVLLAGARELDTPVTPAP
ncbi:MAG TPA: RsmE family RNA methyltransferase [Candidatus Angelobacter sp.]|nr:RsmE family RNA methyltransferase [Candidatus Angelobacter sp.]